MDAIIATLEDEHSIYRLYQGGLTHAAGTVHASVENAVSIRRADAFEMKNAI